MNLKSKIFLSASLLLVGFLAFMAPDFPTETCAGDIGKKANGADENAMRLYDRLASRPYFLNVPTTAVPPGHPSGARYYLFPTGPKGDRAINDIIRVLGRLCRGKCAREDVLHPGTTYEEDCVWGNWAGTTMVYRAHWTINLEPSPEEEQSEGTEVDVTPQPGTPDFYEDIINNPLDYPTKVRWGSTGGKNAGPVWQPVDAPWTYSWRGILFSSDGTYVGTFRVISISNPDALLNGECACP